MSKASNRAVAALVGLLGVMGCGSDTNSVGGGSGGNGGAEARPTGAGGNSTGAGGAAGAAMGTGGNGGTGVAGTGGTAGPAGRDRSGTGGAGPTSTTGTGGAGGGAGGGASCAATALTRCQGTMSGAWCVDQFPGDASGPIINALWSGGPTDVWAVGSQGAYTLGVGAATGVLLHWDGCQWQKSLVPGAGFNDVWGASATDVWTVGDRGTALHWDGAAWSPVATGTTTTILAAVSGTGSRDVWAVGLTGALHWNGTAWSLSPEIAATPGAFYSFGGDIWAAAPNDVWVAMAGVARGSVAHFDGASWAITPVSPRTDFLLFGVWSDGATTWAVGEGTQILKRSAGAWMQVQPPGGSSVGFTNVMAAGADVYAVGESLVHATGGGAFQPDNDAPAGSFKGLWVTSSQVWVTGSETNAAFPSGVSVIIHRAR